MHVIEHYEGIFSFSAFKVDANGEEIPGTRREPVKPFKNLITNAGLDRMGGFSDYLQWCQVGSSSTAPVAGNTTLGARIAGTSTISSTVNGAEGSAPYFTWRRNVMRFAQGVATGVLAEVGIGWTSTGNLFSHALIRDSLGNPTTITVLSDESLDVTYELRCYPSVTDVTGTIVATGNIGGTYDYILRAANVTNSGPTGWAIDSAGRGAGQIGALTSSRAVSPGDIGPVTGSITGAAQGAIPISVSPYSAGSYKRDFTLNIGPSRGNFATGIRSATFKVGIGAYQLQVNPTIMKTDVDEVVFSLSHSWSRRP